MQRVHEELGLGPELRALTKPLDPAFQAVMPKHRLDIRSNREALLKELRLEFPQLVAPVEAFFTRLFSLDDQLSMFLANAPPLPPATWIEKFTTRSAIKSMAAFDAPFESDALLAGIPPQHPVRDLLLGPLTFFGHLWGDTPSTFHAVRLIARYYRGVNAMEHGAGGLARTLLQAAERAGVTVKRNCVIKTLHTRRTRLTELVLEDDRLPQTAEYFVTNTVGPFFELLPAESRVAKFVVEEQRPNPTGSLLVVNLVVKRKVVPYGMASALFLLNGRRQGRGDEAVDPPLFVQRFAATRSEDAAVRGRLPSQDEEHEVLSIACPVRVQDVAHSPGRLTALKNQIIGRVRRVIPFLDDNLADVSLPIDTSGWDPETEHRARRVDPWRLHPIYEPGTRPLLGVAARPARTYFKNLVHCGQDAMPGLGIEGEYISGVNAVSALYKMAGRRWLQQ